MGIYQDHFFRSIYNASQHSKEAAEKLKGREPFIVDAIVTANNDPQNLRRIKATHAGTGSSVDTDWLFHCHPFPFHDAPLPLPGQTVVIAFFKGDPHRGVWFGVLTNRVNPPFSKSDPVYDDYRVIEGSQTLQAGKTITFANTKAAVTIDEGGSITASNASGASIAIGSDGSIFLSAATGQNINLQATHVAVSSTAFTWNGLPVDTNPL